MLSRAAASTPLLDDRPERVGRLAVGDDGDPRDVIASGRAGLRGRRPAARAMPVAGERGRARGPRDLAAARERDRERE